MKITKEQIKKWIESAKSRSNEKDLKQIENTTNQIGTFKLTN